MTCFAGLLPRLCRTLHVACYAVRCRSLLSFSHLHASHSYLCTVHEERMVQLSCTKNKSQEKLLGCSAVRGKVSRRLGASLDFRQDFFLAVDVSRTPTRTACTGAHSVSAYHTAQSDHTSSREHAWLKPWCAQNNLSSTRHVSFFAAPDTDHQHKFSLTCLSNLTVVLPHTQAF